MANSYDDTHRDKILSNMMDDIDKDNDNDLSETADPDENNVADPEFCAANRICTRVAWHPKGLHFALPCADDTVKIFSIKGYSYKRRCPQISHQQRLISLICNLTRYVELTLRQ